MDNYINEMDLIIYFQIYGNIKSVKIIESETNYYIFHAYLNFENTDSVEEALKADGSYLKSNIIRVKRVKVN